ncbi:MAG TPA: AraC family transcriptional regulator, partial [Solirubrobacteraceae bacterium]|nr:AraC family transcriptional regulator [Solirubrobacteraceae bacterium]
RSQRAMAVAEVAEAAGYGSTAAFSRAFARAYGAPPTAHEGDHRLPAPNGIHFHPPGGLLLPAGGGPSDRRIPTIRQPTDGLTERLVAHHLDRVRELLDAAAELPADALAEERRPGFVAVWFEGEEASAAVMAERLVFTLEVWVAAMGGEERPETAGETLRQRFDRAAPRFARFARTVRPDDAFVDALCEPPQSFTYGGVLAHVVTYGAVRAHALAALLAELGATNLSTGDPILWEEARAQGVPSAATRR